MNKINIFDLKRPTSDDFMNIQQNINQSLENLGKSEYGVVKEGFSLKIERGNIKCSSGYGFSPSGNLIKLDKEITIFTRSGVEKNHIYFIYLKYVRITKTKKEITRGVFTETENTSIIDPYKEVSPPSKNHLLIGFIENGIAYSLNREEQIPSFAIGTCIFYLGEFRDYITLRGCKVLSEYNDRYIKMSDVSGRGKFYDFDLVEYFRKQGEEHEEDSPYIQHIRNVMQASDTITLSLSNIPSFGSDIGHKITGNTTTSVAMGGHGYHDFKKCVNGRTFGRYGSCKGFYSNCNRKEKDKEIMSYAGNHKHTGQVEHVNNNPIPIPINPEFYTLRLIYREY